MAVGEPKGTPGANRPRDEHEPIYEGRAGGTRLRSVHVPSASGVARTLEVYDSVNVATDPHLREPSLSGALHRFEGGELLALPFVYHDPHARKLALVVPDLLRYEELELRAKLLSELARDTDHPIPSYAREATSVVGTAGLVAYLERPSGAAVLGELTSRESSLSRREAALVQRDAVLAQREASVLSRESHIGQREASVAQREATVEAQAKDFEARIEVLSQREIRLQARAEQVTSREDELRSISEEVEAAQADVAMREQELESRFESVGQREADLARRAEQVSREEDVVQLADDEVQLGDDEVENVDGDVEELEKIATSPGDVREDELRDAVQLVEERAETVPPAALADLLRPHLGGLSDAPLADRVAERGLADAAFAERVAERALVDEEDALDDLDDDVEELDDIEPIGDVTGLHADLRAEDTDLRRRDEAALLEPLPAPIALPASEPPPPSVPASVAPPPGFLDSRHGHPVRAAAEAGGVRIFVRLPESSEDLLREEAAPELLVQLAVVEEQPVVLLTLVDEHEGRPRPMRAALDARAPDDRAILENLRRRFAARVAVFSATGRYLRSFDVSAPRELNVARILERLGRMRTAAAVDAATAIERVLSAPPPVRAKDHPFVEAAGAARPANAAAAAEELDRVAEWTSHDKLDHALLVLSIPHERVNGTVRRALEHAVEHGLALASGLSERAVSLGVAPDVTTLLGRQIAACAATSQLADRGGLSAERLAETWERLLATATENEVAIDTATHELAWKLIRDVRGGGGPAEIDVAKLPEMGMPELVMLLEHPRHRRDAALELCRRQDPALAETLCKSIRKMPRAEVVRLVPRLIELGEEAGDALIDGLDARKTFVRQAFALALGHLKLRRAVVPLVHLLASEESEVWREVARVVGGFGTASLRNVTRQLREPKGREERYVWTLAHLANHGCAKQIERLTTDAEPAVAKMAVEALTWRERARTAEDQVRGAAALTGEDSVLTFSRRFYQEMEGHGPSDDLEELPGADA